MAVVMNTSLGLELHERSVFVIVLVAFISAFMSVITGMYVELVIREHYKEEALKELKEKKDEN
jgi:hypothetical protein